MTSFAPAPHVAETPFFFRSGQGRLFGTLHRPQPGCDRATGVVLCAPTFEEKLWTHRVFVTVARALATEGYPVLRFDHMGHGDSDGDFDQCSVGSHLDDIAAAVQTLKQEADCGAIALLGLRLGATFALLHAERDPSIGGLMLWDPVTDGAAYMQEVLMINLATQLSEYREIRETREDLVGALRQGRTVNIEGYELSPRFFDEASAIQLAGPRTYQGPSLIVQIGKAAQRPRPNLETLAAALPRADLRQVTEDAFWKEIRPFYSRCASLTELATAWMADHVR